MHWQQGGGEAGAGLFALLRMAPFMAIIKLTLPAPLMSFFMYFHSSSSSTSSPSSFTSSPSSSTSSALPHFLPLFLFSSPSLSTNCRLSKPQLQFDFPLSLSLYRSSLALSLAGATFMAFRLMFLPLPSPFYASAGVNLFIILFGSPSHSRLSENLIIAFSPVALAFAAVLLLLPLLSLLLLPLLSCFFFSVRPFVFNSIKIHKNTQHSPTCPMITLTFPRQL